MRIYYFKKEVDKEFALDELPEDREVIENERTGLPLVRRVRSAAEQAEIDQKKTDKKAGK